ncbi:inorganic phosphate transporter, PiT family [Quadrisphaera granulorum]|uniref:PiT family inorganic phosphate transporter n=1 Tax=Quadrisphaera granulorum TaxID=317664 RepID=A0A316A2H5_9ACTN|nr:inorganic phosphate transporter [Quadrisphaera granulorum]PWJ51793.1 PiT family inorganic phosphate transporter [Quadrisphaera granulorum]SZE97740.1 inorganic phosphate transporter, PiT family [Quadrisphaera granulorum]
MDPGTGTLLVVVVVAALVFAAINGAHDASDVIATPVATRALTPGTALVIAAVLNGLGGLLGLRLAEALAYGVLDPLGGRPGLVLVLSALLGATAWNVLTWWRGIPSSSTHALVGGLAGAGAVVGARVDWMGAALQVALPLLASPLLGYAVSALVSLVIAWRLRHAAPGRAHRTFRYAQVVSSSGVAVGHGLQDAQKTMGVVVLALVAAGALSDGAPVPWWVVGAASGALALGTLAGGWRIVRTLATGITRLDSPAGFSAEVTTTGVLALSAAGLGVPVSTTHVVTAAIAGAGGVHRLSAVRWRVVRRIVGYWVLTAPGAAAGAALFAVVLLPLLG